MDTLQERKDELEKELAGINAQLDLLNKMGPAERLAIRMHEKNCNLNHTDVCGWFYEISAGEHNWSSWTHADYLKDAKMLMDAFGDVDAAFDMYKMIKKMK